MKILNLGCGNTRPSEPWVNVDSLHAMFPEGTPEREQIDALPNYVDADLRERLPFDDNEFDGCLLSHVLEHFPAQSGLRLLVEARRVLKPGGVIIVSVPDAAYFRKVYPQDCVSAWPQLFDTTDPNNTFSTFFEAALWFNEHEAILTEDAVWCYLMRAMFSYINRVTPGWITAEFRSPEEAPSASVLMCDQLNRLKFSLIMEARKP